MTDKRHAAPAPTRSDAARAGATRRAVQSMTGYANRSCVDQPELGLELRGVNSRFLDLVFRVPDELRSVEPGLRDLLRQRLDRGKVECRVSLQSAGGPGTKGHDPDPVALAALRSLLDRLGEAIPGLSPPSASDLLHLPALFARPPDPETLAQRLLALAEPAIEDFIASRSAEGDRLVGLIEARLDEVAALASGLRERVPQITAAFEARLAERIARALDDAGTAGGLDPGELAARVSQEVAVFGLRADVAEELDRLGAHVDECRQRLRGPGPVGKRLDFLMQEMNREANTLGSKASAIDLTRTAIDLKVLIEQIREQVQNLE